MPPKPRRRHPQHCPRAAGRLRPHGFAARGLPGAGPLHRPIEDSLSVETLWRFEVSVGFDHGGSVRASGLPEC